jgi:hypothetical protein
MGLPYIVNCVLETKQVSLVFEAIYRFNLLNKRLMDAYQLFDEIPI